MRGNKYDSHLFAEAQAEVFRLMDRDSFSVRFLPVLRKRFGACKCFCRRLHGLLGSR